jgi:hypothetical protein
MGDLHLPVRTDWSDSGFFGFMKTGVKHASDGHEMLRQYVPFDQGDFVKEDVSGLSTYSKLYESATSRVYDNLNADATGTHKIRRRLRLPRDFGRSAPAPLDGSADAFLGLFPTDALSLFTYRTGSLTSLKVTLEKAGTPDSVINGVSVSPSSASVWQMFALTPGDAYNPGDFLTLTLEYVSSTVDVAIRIADYTLAYLTTRGNV